MEKYLMNFLNMFLSKQQADYTKFSITYPFL